MVSNARFITMWACELCFESFIKLVFVIIDDIYEDYRKTFTLIGVK